MACSSMRCWSMQWWSMRGRLVTRAAFCLGLLAALCACETSDDDPTGPGRTAGGFGPSTLRVEVTVDVENRVSNATATDDFDTYVSVVVQRDGERVPDALVFLGRGDMEPAPLLPDEGLVYRGDHVGWVGSYTLDVEAGADTLTGVLIPVPAVHVVTAPAGDANLSIADDLTVRWDVSGADAVRVSLGGARLDAEGDGGEATLSAEALATLELDGSARLPLWVERTVRNALYGGAAGSRVTVNVRNGWDSVGVSP